MMCEECGQRPATVHVTRIVNNQKTEMRLCEECAREKGGFGMFTLGPVIDMNQLLAGLLHNESAPVLKAETSSPLVKCSGCGLTYADFAKNGRLGCGQCYETFKRRLDVLLKRIHGSMRHVGKVPKRAGDQALKMREIEALRQELERAIMLEEYEKAAEIRDQLKSMERDHNY